MLKDYMAGAVAALIILPFAVGCSTNQSVVRGQNPDVLQVGAGVVQAGHEESSGHTQYAVVPVSHSNSAPCDCPGGGVNGGYAGPYHDGTWNGYHVNGQDQCEPDGSGSACLNCPKHTHWYRYKEPQGLVYPPANQPAALVQYPYFTVRGPTDFFMK